MNFLCDGEIHCKEGNDAVKILENLDKLFGFDERLDLQNDDKEPSQLDESFCPSSDTELLADKEEALDNVVVIPIVKSINPIKGRRKVQKSGGAKRRLFIDNNNVASDEPINHLSNSQTEKEVEDMKKGETLNSELVTPINQIQRRLKVPRSGGAKRRLFGRDVASDTVKGDKTQFRTIKPFSKSNSLNGKRLILSQSPIGKMKRFKTILIFRYLKNKTTDSISYAVDSKFIKKFWGKLNF